VPDALLKVRVQTGAKRDELGGRRDGALVVRVTAAPVDGKANHAVCRLLARLAGIPPSDVEVVRGISSRDKTVRLGGIAPADAAARLGYS
jgi:uncharacterized protein (TIGR00251 family)